MHGDVNLNWCVGRPWVIESPTALPSCIVTTRMSRPLHHIILHHTYSSVSNMEGNVDNVINLHDRQLELPIPILGGGDVDEATDRWTGQHDLPTLTPNI